ncbi:retrotransposable element Tf2 [Tanacetum coccineum]
MQVKLLMSTFYHPQTDCQTKVANRCLEGYLRCMTGEHPKEWARWLSLAELWYNSNFHTATQSTPFETMTLKAREDAIQTVKFHLTRAQNRMKQQPDKGMSKRSFEVIAKVSQVAYQLALNSEAQIHDVFYVSQLKKHRGEVLATQQVIMPHCDQNGLHWLYWTER